MVATCTLSESNGAGETKHDDVANVNLGSQDTYEVVPANAPITAGQNSYSKYLQLHFTGTFNKIDNLKVWASSATPTTNASIVYDTVTVASYAAPSTTSIGTTAIPTSEPSANVGIGGSLSGSLTAIGYSDYIRIQEKTASNSPAGNTTQITFTFQYDEQ
jgi:hypothetical protein